MNRKIHIDTAALTPAEINTLCSVLNNFGQNGQGQPASATPENLGYFKPRYVFRTVHTAFPTLNDYDRELAGQALAGILCSKMPYWHADFVARSFTGARSSRP